MEFSSSPLLRLPREIRDIILSYILVTGTIPLEPAVTKAPRSRIAVGGEVGFCEALYQQYKLTYPLDSRSTWTIPLQDLAIPEEDFQLDSITIFMTYQYASSIDRRRKRNLGTSLLQVCKQIYVEGSEIFYGKNNFSFAHDFRIPTAAAFFRDRSATSLRLIKALELSLMDVEESTPGAGDLNSYTGRHVLQCDYGYYTELCNLLSSPGMQLRKLSLTVETSRDYSFGDVYPVSRALDLDGLKWSNAHGNRATDIVDWVHPLLNIKTLDHLSVFWINQTHARIVGRTAALMAQHMIRSQPGRRESQNAFVQESIEILYRTAILGLVSSPEGCAVVTYDPANEHVAHRNCATAIWDDGHKLIRGDREYATSKFERLIVREYLDAFHGCLTCYYELNSM